eukprot:m51a1_g254 hypothetical protein (265) ;mRNA; f:199758-201032
MYPSSAGQRPYSQSPSYIPTKTSGGVPAPVAPGYVDHTRQPSIGAPQAATPQPAKPEPTEEVRLFTTPRERELCDNLANLYAIVKTTEHLERAYARDSVPADLYTAACAKLIAQFRAARDLVSPVVPNVEKFIADYKLDCAAAEKRLIRIGVPATVEYGGQHSGQADAQTVLDAGQNFITAMDSLRLNMVEVDQLHPLLTSLLEALNKLTTLPTDFEGKVRVRTWLTKLNSMRANEKLSEEDTRQLLFELESSYNALHRALSRS